LPCGVISPRATARSNNTPNGGFDSTLEELYFAVAAAAIRRGYHCLTFAGPGQGDALREQGLPFRPDWERVVTPMVDYALTRPEVDAARVALMGWSYGGYFAPRAAAFEPRIAALIAWDGLYDLLEPGLATVPPEARSEMARALAANPHALDAPLREMMRADLGIRWALTNGMYTFGVGSPGEYVAKLRDYNLQGVAEHITCPTLVCEAEQDHFFRGQPEQLFAALTCPKTFMRFTTEEGAEEHCHAGAHALFHERAFRLARRSVRMNRPPVIACRRYVGAEAVSRPSARAVSRSATPDTSTTVTSAAAITAGAVLPSASSTPTFAPRTRPAPRRSRRA